MKLLKKEELKGIDSTKATIEKWDKFFKKALVNLGYKDELIKNMYPYSRGIPMIEGDRLPVDEITGRRFFRMSDADKLAAMLLSCTKSGDSGRFNGTASRIKIVLLSMFANKQLFDVFFKDLEDKEEVYAQLTEVDRDEARKTLWKYFLDNCDIFRSNLAIVGHNSNGMRQTDSYLEGWMDDGEKSTVFQGSADTHYNTFFVYFKPLENSFGELNFETVTSEMIRVSNTILPDSLVADRLSRYKEVYLQEYLCVSLNPIDKFMCSTKQAFGSCMSIAKQNDTVGTSSYPAFGLPAMFDTDGVFMIFMTPGKHKNMYWETSEWIKDGPDRDKEKAYKYLKMTCRSLTYQGTLHKSKIKLIEKAKSFIINSGEKDNPEAQELLDIFNRIEPEKERLYIGRQYCSGSAEDNIWQIFISVALTRAGIRTSMYYANAIKDLVKHYRRDSNFLLKLKYATHETASLDDLRFAQVLLEGSMTDDKVPVAIDRYGYLRGFYYDNVSIPFTRRARAHNYTGSGRSLELEKLGGQLGYRGELTEENESYIRVGSSRHGSGSIASYATKSGLDMFKVLLGIQDYTYINSYVKICNKCKKILLAHEESNKLYTEDGTVRHICNDCIEKLGIQKCPSCGELYDKKDAKMHETFNVRKITHPTNWMDMDEVRLCRRQLLKTSGENAAYFLCAHCGRLEKRIFMYSGYSNYFTTEFEGMELNVSFCSKCYNKAVMCDKCKRVLFMDSIKDACLLLPNRRVICSDCIDSIRMKKEKKESLKKVVSDLTSEDLDKEEQKNPDDLGTKLIMEKNIKVVCNSPTLIKDIRKQVNSYLKQHPEREFPVIKESNVPPEEPEPTNEVVDTSDAIAYPF